MDKPPLCLNLLSLIHSKILRREWVLALLILTMGRCVCKPGQSSATAAYYGFNQDEVDDEGPEISELYYTCPDYCDDDGPHTAEDCLEGSFCCEDLWDEESGIDQSGRERDRSEGGARAEPVNSPTTRAIVPSLHEDLQPSIEKSGRDGEHGDGIPLPEKGLGILTILLPEQGKGVLFPEVEGARADNHGKYLANQAQQLSQQEAYLTQQGQYLTSQEQAGTTLSNTERPWKRKKWGQVDTRERVSLSSRKLLKLHCCYDIDLRLRESMMDFACSKSPVFSMIIMICAPIGLACLIAVISLTVYLNFARGAARDRSQAVQRAQDEADAGVSDQGARPRPRPRARPRGGLAGQVEFEGREARLRRDRHQSDNVLEMSNLHREHSIDSNSNSSISSTHCSSNGSVAADTLHARAYRGRRGHCNRCYHHSPYVTLTRDGELPPGPVPGLPPYDIYVIDVPLQPPPPYTADDPPPSYDEVLLAAGSSVSTTEQQLQQVSGNQDQQQQQQQQQQWYDNHSQLLDQQLQLQQQQQQSNSQTYGLHQQEQEQLQSDQNEVEYFEHQHSLIQETFLQRLIYLNSLPQIEVLSQQQVDVLNQQNDALNHQQSVALNQEQATDVAGENYQIPHSNLTVGLSSALSPAVESCILSRNSQHRHGMRLHTTTHQHHLGFHRPAYQQSNTSRPRRSRLQNSNLARPTSQLSDIDGYLQTQQQQQSVLDTPIQQLQNVNTQSQHQQQLDLQSFTYPLLEQLLSTLRLNQPADVAINLPENTHLDVAELTEMHNNTRQFQDLNRSQSSEVRTNHLPLESAPTLQNLPAELTRAEDVHVRNGQDNLLELDNFSYTNDSENLRQNSVSCYSRPNEVSNRQTYAEQSAVEMRLCLSGHPLRESNFIQLPNSLNVNAHRNNNMNMELLRDALNATDLHAVSSSISDSLEDSVV